MRADQVRVLAVGLLDAAPARIARDVDDRRQHVLHAAGARLPRRDREDLLDQLRDRTWPPSAIACGKLVAAGADEAVQRLLVHQRRDAEARLLDQVLLDRVGELGRALGVVVAVRRAA